MKNKEVYTHKNNEVLQNGKLWAVTMNEHDAEGIATTLNKLISFFNEISGECKNEHWRIDPVFDVIIDLNFRNCDKKMLKRVKMDLTRCNND